MNGDKTNRRRKSKEFIKQVSTTIKFSRMKKNFTQEELEKKSGITVSRCESGKYDMTLTTISILSKHLNIYPWELLK